MVVLFSLVSSLMSGLDIENGGHGKCNKNKAIAEIEVINDIHRTNKSDSADRKYSASLEKVRYFVNDMNRRRPSVPTGASFSVDAAARPS